MRMRLSHRQHQQIPNIGTLAVLRDSQSDFIDQKLMYEQEKGILRSTNLASVESVSRASQESVRRQNDSTFVTQVSYE
jgi:hypothetical protein